jgi:hypothetical protein
LMTAWMGAKESRNSACAGVRGKPVEHKRGGWEEGCGRVVVGGERR